MTTTGLRAFIALGANLGNPLQQLDTASSTLGEHPDITRIAMSKVYQSVPHGDTNQPDFFNAVLAIRTTLSARELLAVMHDIEHRQGRERKQRWGARTLDLDLILYGHDRINSKVLTLPHPRAHLREFVVKPLYDLDKSLIIPEQGGVADLLQALPLDNLTEIRDVTAYHN